MEPASRMDLAGSKILVAGARGFIGAAVADALAARGAQVICASRTPLAPDARAWRHQPDPHADTRLFRDFVAGVDHVVNCAGAAHGGRDANAHELADGNQRFPDALARAAAATVPGRLVHLSSIRALSPAGVDAHLTDAMAPRPGDAYGRSKAEGEDAVRREFRSRAGDAVILRPPPVYGTGMRGNLALLLALAKRPWPLPIGGLAAPNAVLARQSLADAVVLALTAPAAGGRAFVLADAEPLTPGEIVAAFRAGLHRRPGLFRVPPIVLSAALAALGRADDYDRLSASVTVDSSGLAQLGWRPIGDTPTRLAALAAGG